MNLVAGRPLPPLSDWQAGELDGSPQSLTAVLLSHAPITAARA